MEKIGVLGCGWLGLAFAKKAIERGYGVNATTTTPSKKQKLQLTQITPFFLEVNENEINGEDLFFKDVSTLIISIPPGLRKNPNRNFDKIIGQIIAKIKGLQVKTSGIAQQNGSLGDNIAILNTRSKKRIDARVTAVNRVEIKI